MDPRLTIAVPLHRAGPWIEGISDTVGKSPAWSRVVISDASHLDDSADRLADGFRGDPRVSVVSREAALGWRAHANLLLEEADTEFFCWMPQDDLVFPDDYFGLLVSALDRNPDRVLAFPAVIKKVTRGRIFRRETNPVSYPPPRVALGSGAKEAEALELLRSWNMALAWRGVFRRDQARPIPDTRDAPDLTWTFSMALAGHLIEVPEAHYLKRFHRRSAHRAMRPDRPDRLYRLYRREVEARLGRGPVRSGEVLKELRGILIRRRFLQLVNPVMRASRFVADAPRVIREKPGPGPGTVSR